MFQPRKLRIVALAVLIGGAFPATAAAQYVETNSEKLVNCPGVSVPQSLTPFDFALSQLVSLRSARNAAAQGDEVSKATQESDNWLALSTALMRISKLQINDFVCAKRALVPFAVGRANESIQAAARMQVLVYRKHIDITQAAIEVVKKLDTMKTAELADQLSTLQVERGQRWADLVDPTTMALLLLIDQTRVENDKLPYLVVSKADRKRLLDYIAEGFPELGNGTTKDKLSDPAKTAGLFIGFLNSRKCSDEK